VVRLNSGISGVRLNSGISGVRLNSDFFVQKKKGLGNFRKNGFSILRKKGVLGKSKSFWKMES
jgi:hypothetical protein